MSASWSPSQSLQYITPPTGKATALQLAQAWQSAGGSSDTSTWTTAVAIALAEQGQYAYGINSDPPGASAGAWQIHYDNWAGLAAAGIISSPNDLKNLTTNANAAIYISGNGQNWSPWSTYTSGTYTGFLSQAAAAVAQLSGKAPATTTTTKSVPPAVSGTGLQMAANFSGTLFEQYDALLKVLDPFALGLLVCVGLLAFSLTGWSNRFASYAAVIIFILLMIHSSATNGATPNGTSSAAIPPASQIMQPKITYNNQVTWVPQQQQQSSSSSGSSDISGLLSIGSLLGFL